MATLVRVLNGTNLTRDEGILSLNSQTLDEGVRQNFQNECEVTLNQVDTGMVFVEVTRTAVSPNETYLIPVWITAPAVVDTSGNGWIIVEIDLAKINDGSANAADGSGVAVTQKVTSLPLTNPYLILATLSAGAITDARVWTRVSDYVLPDVIHYDEDAEASDDYVITVNGVTALVDGAEFSFKANTVNTGAATLKVNSLAAKDIRKKYNIVLDNADIEAGQLVTVRYDSDNDWFQMMSLPSTIASFTKATTNQAETGTDDNAYMTPLKSVQSLDFNLKKFEGEAGESINGSVTKKALSQLGKGYDTIFMNSHATNGWAYTAGVMLFSDFGDTDNTYKKAQGFSYTNPLPQTIKIRRVIVPLRKYGAPTDNVDMHVYTSAAGLPNALVADGDSANNIAGAGLPVSTIAKPSVFTYATLPEIASGDSFHLVLERDTAIDGVNYYGVGHVAGTYGFGQQKYQASGTAWSTFSGNNWHCYIELEIDGQGLIFKADANDLDRLKFVGFSGDNVVATDAIIIQDMGSVDTLSSLVIGNEVWLDDIAGAVVSDSPKSADNAAVLIGRAIAANKARLRNGGYSLHHVGAPCGTPDMACHSMDTGVTMEFFVKTGFRPKRVEAVCNWSYDGASTLPVFAKAARVDGGQCMFYEKELDNNGQHANAQSQPMIDDHADWGIGDFADNGFFMYFQSLGISGKFNDIKYNITA